MTAKIDMGSDGGDRRIAIDLEELLATRLLVQGNSGSGKSHLLRRLLEGSAGLVQQIVIDPEGDFVSLADAFGHVPVDAADHALGEIARLAARVREHRASVVLNLEGLEVDDQLRCAATFLNALFDAPRDLWFPVLVVVDEAQLFAPAAAGDVGEEARRLSLAAMTNLMCRGRKRGLAGVIATQRLAKLAKNVAAEASNFLMGRTFLDIDMARAADLLGMERRQAETIRDLQRGEFLALGPAVSRRPVSVRIGEVRTGTRNAAPRLIPLPGAAPEDVRNLLFVASEADAAMPPPPPPSSRPVKPLHELMQAIATAATEAPVPALPQLDDDQQTAVRRDAIAAIAADAPRQPVAVQYQDFTVRCRMAGAEPGLSLDDFRRRLALAQAGITDTDGWDDVLTLAASLPEEMLAPFIGLARAAREGQSCPDDDALAALYGTSSVGRARRMLAFIEEKGLIVARTDLTGRRSISFPHLGWSTAPAEPPPAAGPARRPARTAR